MKHQRVILQEERVKSSKLVEINETISAIDEKAAASNENLKLAKELEENALETLRVEL